MGRKYERTNERMNRKTKTIYPRHKCRGIIMDFFRNYCSLWYKVGRCSPLNEYMKLHESQRSRSFIDLGPNHSDPIVFNFLSSITADFNISSALRWARQDQWSSDYILMSRDTENRGQCRQNLITSFPHPNNVSMQVSPKSTHWFTR